MAHFLLQNIVKVAITDDCQSKSQLIANLQTCLSSADLIILRQYAYSQRADLFWQSILDYISSQPNLMIKPMVFNGSSTIKLPLAMGLHYKSNGLQHLKRVNKVLSSNILIGQSCHSLAQAEMAQQAGADYILVSPIKTPLSHPSQGANLGWLGLKDIAQHISIPIFALGGMKLADLAPARLHGAQGIAGISWYSPSN